MADNLKVGDLIYSEYFGRLIKIAKINSDNDWYFEIDGVVEKAQTPLSFFERVTQ